MSDEKLALTPQDLREADAIRFDSAGRAYPNPCKPYWRYIYSNGYRPPSRAYPYSYMKPLMTKKFAKWLMENHRDEAAARGLCATPVFLKETVR